MFSVGYWARYDTPEESRRIYWPKYCEYNNKDENNSLNILRDEKGTCHQVDFVVPTVGKVHIKETESVKNTWILLES